METNDKSLKERAIDIKGKQYVLVADRVLYFNEKYPNGCIQTQRIITEEPSMEIFKAIVIPDCDKPDRFFTGYAQGKRGEGFINKTAAMENAETSAVGRALAFLGIGVIDSIASADEVVKAENSDKKEVKEAKRFNEPELENLKKNIDYLKKFNSSDELIKDIEKLGYKLSKEKKQQVADIWASVD